MSPIVAPTVAICSLLCKIISTLKSFVKDASRGVILTHQFYKGNDKIPKSKYTKIQIEIILAKIRNAEIHTKS